MVGNDGFEKKATLIADGQINVDSHTILPHPLSISSAGPGIRSKSIALEFNGLRVKLQVTRGKDAQFHLHREAESFSIYQYGIPFLDSVQVLPVYYHAPDQAFINLGTQCIFKCLFCKTNNVPSYVANYLNSVKFFSYLESAIGHPSVQSIAFTSGVYPNSLEVVDRLCTAIKYVKKRKKLVPVGVEPYVSSLEDIDVLKRAGADEIKINLQVSDIVLFDLYCPNMDFLSIFDFLRHAVDVFGKGNVCSNILFGLGESDSSIIFALEKMAQYGVVPTLRKVRLDDDIIALISQNVGYIPDPVDKNRILKLGYIHKEILKKYKLTPRSFNTMCHRCRCCDLTPFIDF